jgi:hypothetical protein
VDPAYQSWASIVGWSFSMLFVVLGLGVTLANATNIERPLLVGGFTAAGGLIMALLMWRTQALGGPFSWWQILGYVFIGCAFFACGRLADYMLGPTPANREADEETMGAHLSD